MADLNTVMVRCTEARKAEPFAAWKLVSASLYSSDPDANTTRVLTCLRDDANLYHAAPLLELLMPLSLAENDTTRLMDSRLRSATLTGAA